MKSISKALLIISLSFLTVFSQTAEWQQTHGPLTGDVSAMAMLGPDSIIAGTRLGGMYRSTDGGNNWQYIDIESFLFVSVWDFKLNSKGDIFAATSSGVYRSTDRGNSWLAFTEGLNHWFVEGLVINATDVIFAATRSGVFRSEDNGETWQEFNTGLTALFTQDISITPLGDIIVSTQNGIFISYNNGDSWTEISEGLSNKYTYTVFPVNEDTLLAGTLDGGYISTDHGMNWEKLTDIFGLIFSFTRQSDSLLYAGGGGYFFKSLDNGITWTQTLAEKINFATFWNIFSTPEKLISATHIYGIMQSTDSGSTWQQTNAGLKISDAKRFASNASGDIFLGSAEGIYRTSDGGENWQWISDPDYGTNTRAFAISNSGRIFANMSGSMVISDDNGQSWDYADSTLSERFAESIAFGNGDDVYVGFWGRIFKSINGGDTWTEVQDSLPQTSVKTMIVADDGTVFAGTGANGVLRSNDGGVSWDEVNNGLGEYYDITSFLLLENGDLLAAAFDGVYQTSNDGDSWVKLGNPPTWGLKDLKMDSHGNLFISMRGGGVAVSEDSGITWNYINTNLYNKDAQGLFIDTDDTIYLGVRGAGVFKTQFIPTAVSIKEVTSQHPQVYRLEQNYPNPFNPETIINYELGITNYVELKIFDITGREIEILVNKRQTAGSYQVTWDATGFASGIYYYQLTAGNLSTSSGQRFQQVKMMVLLK